MEHGNFSNVKAVGQGVSEYKIDFGPGYRIYFGKDGETLVILLGGGTKKRQSRDIEVAQDHWKNYKRRKRKQKQTDSGSKAEALLLLLSSPALPGWQRHPSIDA